MGNGKEERERTLGGRFHPPTHGLPSMENDCELVWKVAPWDRFSLLPYFSLTNETRLEYQKSQCWLVKDHQQGLKNSVFKSGPEFRLPQKYTPYPQHGNDIILHDQIRFIGTSLMTPLSTFSTTTQFLMRLYLIWTANPGAAGKRKKTFPAHVDMIIIMERRNKKKTRKRKEWGGGRKVRAKMWQE